MKYTEFKNSVDSDKIYPIYLFEGEDAFFRERGASMLAKKFVQEPEINCAYFDGEKLLEKELVTSIEQYPFLSNYRISLVREYYPKKNGMDKRLIELFTNPVQNSILVILNEKSSDFLKSFQDVCVVDCSKADVSMIARWIKAKCYSAGVEISFENASTLANYCALDMVRVESETEKLISYSFENKVITLEDISCLVNKDNEYKIYEMTEHIAKRQFSQALVVIKDMLNKGESLQHLLVSIYNYFRRLLHVAISKKSNLEIAKTLDLKEFAVSKAKTQAKMFSKRGLKQAVDMLVDTDYLIKSGMCDADDKIWYTIFRIMVEGE